MQTICLYHANCFDGMAAAWVVKQVYLDAECIPVQYGQDIIVHNDGSPIGISKETRLLIVDFSFPRERMEALYKQAGSMLVLDHHKTARENCEGLSFCIFDMNQSGAGLAWDHLMDTTAPNLVRYIEDRDLWRFDLKHSREINAYIQSFPMTLENYDMLATELDQPEGLSHATVGGESIERYKNLMVKSICKHAKLKKIGEWYVPVVQSGILMSEVGHYMCKQDYDYANIQNLLGSKNHICKPPFAASYFVRDDGMTVYSLRSLEDFDVSAVAKSYGGGGHRNAAGFQVLEML